MSLCKIKKNVILKITQYHKRALLNEWVIYLRAHLTSAKTLQWIKRLQAELSASLL